MVVQAALERFLDPAPPVEGLIHETLARVTSQLERLDGDVRIIAETVALHARYHLTVTPPLAQPQQREACALDQERFKALADQVDRCVRLGRPLMRESELTRQKLVPRRLTTLRSSPRRTTRKLPRPIFQKQLPT